MDNTRGHSAQPGGDAGGAGVPPGSEGPYVTSAAVAAEAAILAPGPLPSAAPLTRLQVLVVDRDPEHARRLAEALLQQGAQQVGTPASRDELEAMVSVHSDHTVSWNAVLYDDAVGGGSLLPFLQGWHSEHGDIPLLLLTEEISAERAMAALRGKAADLLLRSTRPVELADAVRRAYDAVLDAQHGAARPGRMLVIGAHPDDVEIGAGGTIHRRAQLGWDITVLTLSHGAHGGDPGVRVKEARAAADLLGADLVVDDMPDGDIPGDVTTVRAIERVVRACTPDVVLVHSAHDTHQDHRAVHRAARVAARGVGRLGCYQSPSATADFSPTRFVGIREEDLEAKLAAIRLHHSQSGSRAYLDEDLLRATARYWSRFTHDVYAEPQELLRDTLPTGIPNGD